MWITIFIRVLYALIYINFYWSASHLFIFSSELHSLSRISRRAINICMMQTREQLRIPAAGTIITRARAKLMGGNTIMLNKVTKKKKLIARRKSVTMERQYMTPAAQRADATIQRLLRTQKDSDSPIPPILMFNPWVSPSLTIS
jgi:hypothetical protein